MNEESLTLFMLEQVMGSCRQKKPKENFSRPACPLLYSHTTAWTGSCKLGRWWHQANKEKGATSLTMLGFGQIPSALCPSCLEESKGEPLCFICRAVKGTGCKK